MKVFNHKDNTNGEYYGCSVLSPKYPFRLLSGFTIEESERILELVQAAMLQSLIERGELKLGFIKLKIRVDQQGRLYIARKEPYVLENLLEHGEDPMNLMDFLHPYHLKRLRLLKERHGSVQKDNG
jgi:hypothetical protein